jgi:hypothetical protein
MKSKNQKPKDLKDLILPKMYIGMGSMNFVATFEIDIQWKRYLQLQKISMLLKDSNSN